MFFGPAGCSPPSGLDLVNPSRFCHLHIARVRSLRNHCTRFRGLSPQEYFGMRPCYLFRRSGGKILLFQLFGNTRKPLPLCFCDCGAKNASGGHRALAGCGFAWFHFAGIYTPRGGSLLPWRMEPGSVGGAPTQSPLPDAPSVCLH